MGLEAVEEAAGAGEVLRVYFQPGVDEGADEPAPHRSLMIGGVASPQIAEVAGFIVRMDG